MSDVSGDLLLVVKSKDVTQEQQEKELQVSKRECGQLRREMLANESVLKQRLGEEEARREVVEQQLRIVEERADALQAHLHDICKGAPSQSEVKSAPPDVTISDETATTSEDTPSHTKQTDQGFWMQRVTALERELAEERQRCRAAEKRAELLGGDVAEVPPQSPRPGEGEEAALREREKELLKFESLETILLSGLYKSMTGDQYYLSCGICLALYFLQRDLIAVEFKAKHFE
ncbi:uncharacterized protein LOC129254019 [Lytechinus pictus]|uniref:uncharacterized protein LOC129254019 n=1 Tax=Lytechinus pictus TaxID=7653 RepID=UPI0030BA2AB7